MVDAVEALTRPEKVWSRSEVLQRRSPVPSTRGVYAWWFREVPPGVPVETSVTSEALTLLYVGIAPSRDASKSTLRSRIRQHFRGNASGSTLRLTLGCLLAQQLGIQLVRVGATGRRTFGVGEQRLSDWMAANAFVCWIEHPQPWDIRAELIATLRPPLNLADSSHPFGVSLKHLRRAATATAPAASAPSPQVLILSEQMARLYQPRGREVCISVTDPDQPPALLSDRFLAVLRLAFTDIDRPPAVPPWVVLFTPEHAREVVQFVHTWNDVDRIVIHCRAGLSRSPGIAMGLCDVFSWPLGEMERQHPLGNKWVRQELARIGREMRRGE